MTENIAVLDQKVQDLERRFKEGEWRSERQFESIVSSLGEINSTLHALDTSIKLFQRDIDTHKDSGVRRTSEMKELEEAIAETRLQVAEIKSTHDGITKTIRQKKRDPVQLWTSIAAAGTAIGSAIFAFLHGAPKP